MAGEKPAVVFAKGEAPQDKWHAVKIMAFFAGFAVIFPSAALTASTDLYTEIYGEDRGERLLFFLSLAITMASPFIQLLLSKIQHKISYSSRILSCLLANTCLAGIFPFILLFLSSGVSFPLVILLAFIMGVNNAVLKLSFFSLTSYYPASYQHDIVFGKGLSPLLVVILKMAIKWVGESRYPDDLPFAIRRGSIVFFSLAALVPFLCAVIYRYARRTSLFSKHFFPSFRMRKLLLAAQNPNIQTPAPATNIRHALAGLTANQDQEELHIEPESPRLDAENPPSQGSQQGAFTDLGQGDFIPHSSSGSELNINVVGATNGEYVSLDDENNSTDPMRRIQTEEDSSLDAVGRVASSFDPKPEIVEAPVNTWTVLVKISLPAFILALTMAVTYTIYPAILVKSKPTIGMTKGWFKLWLMLIFALSDFLTRSLPYSTLIKICPVSALDLFAYARLIFVPIYAYSVYITTISSQFLILMTLLLGISNGIVFVVTMRNYSHLVADYEKSTAGSLMSIAIVFGVLAGNLLAILLDVVGKM